jgi:hypothetical protein
MLLIDTKDWETGKEDVADMATMPNIAHIGWPRPCSSYQTQPCHAMPCRPYRGSRPRGLRAVRGEAVPPALGEARKLARRCPLAAARVGEDWLPAVFGVAGLATGVFVPANERLVCAALARGASSPLAAADSSCALDCSSNPCLTPALARLGAGASLAGALDRRFSLAGDGSDMAASAAAAFSLRASALASMATRSKYHISWSESSLRITPSCGPKHAPSQMKQLDTACLTTTAR